MSSRISTLNLYNNSVRNIMHSNNNIHDLTESISSGKKMRSFHSSHHEAQFLLNINKEIQLANTYINNSTVVQIRIESMKQLPTC